MTPLKKYIWLVDTLMRAGNTGLTLQQISDTYYYNDGINDGKPYSNRTFHRHREEVRDIFGIEIECYSAGGQYRYRIADSGSNDYFRRWLLDSIAVNRIIGDSREVAQYIGLENADTGHLPAILHALKEQRIMEFDYKPYWADSETHYFGFQAHAIKMFERRWYLIGRYKKEMPYIILSLDRISHLELKEDTFRRDPGFNLEEMFEGVFGIIVHDDNVESIWLKVEAHQANYIRSLPLHSSQMELSCKDKDYAIFALRVRPTFDLCQRILSFGSAVEVLKPESLREEIREKARRMLAVYTES